MDKNEKINIDDWQTYREKEINEQKWQEEARKRVNIFSKIFSIFARTISVSAIGTALAIIIGAFIMIYALFYIVTPKNVLKSLEESYGEKFEIIEDFGAKDSNSKGLYIVSPKSNKNIQFKMYNSNQVRNDNDYTSQRMKYYIEHCENKELLEEIRIDENYVDYKGVKFLRYSLNIELNDYSEIDEKTEKAYKLAKYLHSQDNKIDSPIFLQIRDMVSVITVNCNTEKSLDEEIYSIKYGYIQTLYDNNKKEELQKIGQDEINKIWKPQYLQLIVNEKETIGKVSYNLKDKKYYLVNVTNIFKQLEKINKIEILEIDMFSQDIKKIKYNNKTYKIKQGLSDGKNKNDVIYTEENIDDIFRKLNLEIKYDYSNTKVYIKI